MKRKVILIVLLILLTGCTTSSSEGEIWEEVKRDYSGEIFEIESGKSYLKYTSTEIVFIEKSDDKNFKHSSIYYEKEGDIYYFSMKKLVGNKNTHNYDGFIKINIVDDTLILNCETNNYIKTYKKVVDQKIIDQFN